MKILIAGDFCPCYRVVELFEKEKYKDVLGEVKPFVEQADYSLVNLECPVAGPLNKAIVEKGPNLSCGEKSLTALKWAGFNSVTLANNHFFDFGEGGVRQTLDICDKHGIDHVGGGQNINEASAILYREIRGERLAVINCCEHEFSLASKSKGGGKSVECCQTI